MKYFEDMQLGDVRESVTYCVTEQEIVAMASEWDPQPLHTDRVAASQGAFGRVIACTSHTFSIFSTLAVSREESERVAMTAGLGFDEGRMSAPVFGGDELRLYSEVFEKRLSKSNPGQGVISSSHRLVNQHDVVVFTVKTTILVACRP